MPGKKKEIFLFFHWTGIVTLITVNALFARYADAEEPREPIANKTVPRNGKANLKEAGSPASPPVSVQPESGVSNGNTVSTAKTVTKFIENRHGDSKKLTSDERLQFSIARLLMNCQAQDLTEQQQVLQTQKDLGKIMSESQDLSYQVLMFCRFLEKQLADENSGIDSLVKVRIRYRLEELKKRAGSFYLQTKVQDQTMRSPCRIIDVNKELNVVVLTYGAVENVRVGLAWRVTADDDNRVVLKTVAVRPFVSAAIVIEGDIDSLVPGMAASINVNKQK